MASSLTLLFALLVAGRKSRLDARLRELSGRGDPDADTVGQLARSALPKMGAVLVPGKEEERSRLQTRLLHAGLYGRQSMVVYLGVKLLLMICPPFVGLAAGLV